ncbi:hypothetical protein niasHS_007030 [Heterodera schachtii]|uniref:Uncharacterized protein n=1 Tax=Heterodera schachtii TaxID=97005 RepID=A0ABD2JFA1_HETSC
MDSRNRLCALQHQGLSRSANKQGPSCGALHVRCRGQRGTRKSGAQRWDKAKNKICQCWSCQRGRNWEGSCRGYAVGRGGYGYAGGRGAYGHWRGAYHQWDKRVTEREAEMAL